LSPFTLVAVTTACAAADKSVTEVDAPVDGDVYAPAVDASWIVSDDTGWQSSTSGLRYRIRRYTQ